MEITPGQINAASSSGLTLGNPIPAGVLDDLANTVSVSGLPPELLRPQVIEAVVLRNTLLPSPTQNSSATSTGSPAVPSLPNMGSTQTASSGGAAAQSLNLPNLPLLQIATGAPIATLVRIALQWQGKSFDVISAQPLPPGAPLQIQIGNRNELILRNTSYGVNTASTPATNKTLNTPPIQPSVVSTLTTVSTPAATSTLTSAATLTSAPVPTSPVTAAPALPPATSQTTPLTREQVQQLIQPLVRENLPRQQPLNSLLPVLRELIQPSQLSKLPTPLARAILNLWQALPTPQQLQQPTTLKQALRDSGSYFEARAQLARAIATVQPDALPRVLGTDLKAQIIVLLTLLKSRPGTTAPSPAAADSEPKPAHAVDAGEVVYTKPTPRAATSTPMAANAEERIDALLQQLGKTLEAGLSRIHLNQLDAVLSRHPSADPTQTIPTWVLELPVQTTHGREQINVRIEEHARKQENQRSKQWLVQLGFDLHELGKLSATLTIAGHSVAATIWAEREQTHRTVAREMASLRAGLESVGVNVTEMQCRLGVPPERNGLISQRLVDIHS